MQEKSEQNTKRRPEIIDGMEVERQSRLRAKLTQLEAPSKSRKKREAEAAARIAAERQSSIPTREIDMNMELDEMETAQWDGEASDEPPVTKRDCGTS